MKTEAQKLAKAEANRRYREKKAAEKKAAAAILGIPDEAARGLAVNADLGAALKAEGEKPVPSFKDAVDAAIAAGMTPKQFRKAAEAVAKQGAGASK